MASDAEIEARFWRELRSSPVLMIGLVGTHDAHAQPMTAFFDDDHGPIWFFTSNDNGLVTKLTESHRAIANYVARDHDLFATLHGQLNLDNDTATIERLWNSKIAAWYEEGRQDPKITLLRLDPGEAEIWLGGSSFAAALKRVFGHDPQKDYEGKIAKVTL